MKKMIFIFILLPFLNHAQTICTIAGNGASVEINVTGLATALPASVPQGVASDGHGNIYFVGDSLVRKINSSGIVSTIAGGGSSLGDGGPATNAVFVAPQMIAIDSIGNIYISETDGARIRKINTSGIISTIAGNGVSGYSGNGGPATNAAINCPRGVAVDKLGNVYIAEYNNDVVRKINVSGIISVFAGGGSSWGDGGPATTAQLHAPNGVSVDRFGNVYIADGTGTVRKVNTGGIISTVAGTPNVFGYSGDGGPATAAKLFLPYCVSVDPVGNIYITDALNNNVRKVDTSNIISTLGGTGIGGYNGDGELATTAELYYPIGIAVDTNGRVYVGDCFNHRVRVIEYANISITPSSDTVCSGSSIHFTSAVDNICFPHYQWAINGVTMGVDSADFTTSTLVDHDTVTCSLTSLMGDTVIVTSGSFVVTVLATPSLASPLSVSICDSSVLIYVATTTVSGTTFAWTRHSTIGVSNLPDSGISIINETLNDTVSLPVSVTYNFTLSANGCVNHEHVIVVVDPVPLGVMIASDSVVCIDSSIILAGTVGGGTWASTNASVMVAGDTLTGVTSGRDTVAYSITNACGSGNASYVVTVLTAAQCDSIESIRSLAHLQSDDIEIFPSPVSDQVTISCSQQIRNLSISNMQGQIVYTQKCNVNKVQVDMCKFVSGIYFVKVNGNKVRKFLKE